MISEPILEPVARYFRFKQGLKYVNKRNKNVIVDLGCGPKIRFYHHCKKNGLIFNQYIGIDPLARSKSIKLIKLIKHPLEDQILLPSNSADYVVGFAFIEHIDNPQLIAKEIIRVLKKGGRAILTTPTPNSKKILEFMAYKLGMISKREIREHKHYFTKHELIRLFKNLSVTNITHFYFECKLNQIIIVDK